MTDSIKEKVDHVRNAEQTRKHECHWPGCKMQCKPAMWGCYRHWKKLPPHLRKKIWDTYKPGQEDGTVAVSPEYIKVTHELRDWIESLGGVS